MGFYVGTVLSQSDERKSKMETRTLLRLYLVASLLNDPLFWGPVLLLALAKLGHMSIEQIFISEVIAVTLILILDAPSGVFADMIGRKRSVVIGKVCYLVSVLFFACMTTPVHGFIANIMWALSASLQSGAKSALIYDELKKRNAVHEYRRLSERTRSYWFLMTACTTLATGFLAEIDLRLPLLLSIPGVIVSTVLVFFFPRESPYEHTKSLPNACIHMKEALHEVLKNKRLRSLIIWISLFGITSKMYFFIYNPYLELVEIPYSHVGIIFSLINLSAYLASTYAFRIYKKLHHVGFNLWFGIQSITMFIQTCFAYQFSGWLFGVQGFGRGYVTTVCDPIMNEEIASEKRATVLSFESSLGSLFQVLSFLVMSPLTADIHMFLAVLGSITLIFSFLSRKV